MLDQPATAASDSDDLYFYDEEDTEDYDEQDDEQDDQTDEVVIIGEIGGQEEEKAAAYIQSSMQKKVVAFISGRTAPPGKRMGHAGAIISGGKGGAGPKVEALRQAGVTVVDRPDQIPEAILMDQKN